MKEALGLETILQLFALESAHQGSIERVRLKGRELGELGVSLMQTCFVLLNRRIAEPVQPSFD